MKLIASLIIVLAALTANAQTPKETVRQFYKYDWTHSQIFNRKSIDARKKWFSPDLYKLFLDELQKEEEFLRSNPTDKPYFGDGVPFSPIEEWFSVEGKSCKLTYKIGNAIVKRSRATVPVTFFYRPVQCNETIVYKVLLIKHSGKWLIDDILYNDGDSLANDMKNHKY